MSLRRAALERRGAHGGRRRQDRHELPRRPLGPGLVLVAVRHEPVQHPPRARAPAGEHLAVAVEHRQRRRRRPLRQLGVEPDVAVDDAVLEAEVGEPRHAGARARRRAVVTRPPSPIANGFVAWNEKTSSVALAAQHARRRRRSRRSPPRSPRAAGRRQRARPPPTPPAGPAAAACRRSSMRGRPPRCRPARRARARSARRVQVPRALLDVHEHRLEPGPQHGVDRRGERERGHQHLAAAAAGARPAPAGPSIRPSVALATGTQRTPRDTPRGARRAARGTGRGWSTSATSSARAKYAAMSSTGGSWGAWKRITRGATASSGSSRRRSRRPCGSGRRRAASGGRGPSRPARRTAPPTSLNSNSSSARCWSASCHPKPWLTGGNSPMVSLDPSGACCIRRP